MQSHNRFSRLLAVGSLTLAMALGACGGAPSDAQQEQAPATQESTQQQSGDQQAAQEGAATSGAQTQAATQDRLDKLVLVNKTHALPEGWEEKLDLVTVTNSKGDTVSLDTMAYEPFVQMQADLAQQGITIELNSCYRSVADQQRIVDEFTRDYGEDYVREFVAVPGYSEHHTGIAFDVFLIDNGVPVLTNDEIYAHQSTWDVIHAKLHEYGFILRYMDGKEDITGYTYEPWHYRYVGVEAATEIYNKGLTLEEYLGAA